MEFNIQVYNNVSSYVKEYIKEEKRYHWNIQTNNTLESPNESADKYFIIEKDGSSDAFGHFFYESLPYVCIYKELKKIIPEIKIHIKCKKIFKTLAFKYLDVNEEDLSYTFNVVNKCYFIENMGEFIETIKNPEPIRQVLNNFRILFKTEMHVEKTIPILFMPRQKKENFHGNNREYYTQDIESMVMSRYRVNGNVNRL